MNIVLTEPIGLTEQRCLLLKSQFEEMGHQFTYYLDRKEDKPSLIERIKDADVVIISNIKLDESVLMHAPNLKYLSVAFTGIDHIDLTYCSNHHIEIQNASGYATQAVAELAIGLMLDVYRKITLLDAATRHESTRVNFLGNELSGKVVGVIGTGAIGTKTAKLLQAFGCTVLAWNRTEKKELLALGVQYLPLNQLLSQSDIITIHLPLTKETYHLLSEEKLKSCKPNAVIINTARGNVIDNSALARLLLEGKISGAGIDVFETEPPLPLDHPLLSAPNCVVVPHIGYATREAFDIRIDIVMNHVFNWLKNHHS